MEKIYWLFIQYTTNEVFWAVRTLVVLIILELHSQPIWLAHHGWNEKVCVTENWRTTVGRLTHESHALFAYIPDYLVDFFHTVGTLLWRAAKVSFGGHVLWPTLQAQTCQLTNSCQTIHVMGDLGPLVSLMFSEFAFKILWLKTRIFVSLHCSISQCIALQTATVVVLMQLHQKSLMNHLNRSGIVCLMRHQKW